MSSSSYIFPLENLFDHHSSSDLCFSQFFEPQGSQVLDIIQPFGTKNEQPFDSEMQSELNFDKMFENCCEYSDESLSDVVLGTSSRPYMNDGHFPFSDCRQQESQFGGDETNINDCSSFLRRVCSTGDIMNFVPKHVLKSQRSFSDPLPPRMEEETPKLGRYTPEQRRMSIDKYRAKRSLRNFNKTIKYECRKTLADNRPRIRGRFKRNEDTSVDQVPKSSEEDVIWMERFHAMSCCEETMMYREQIPNDDYGQMQFQYPHSFS